MKFRKAKLKKITMFDVINGIKADDIIEVAEYSDRIFISKEGAMTFTRDSLEFLEEEV